MMPIFAGQPSRNAVEVHCALAQLKPPVAHEDGSEEQPLALIAYTRPLANFSTPVCAEHAERGGVDAAGVEFALVARVRRGTPRCVPTMIARRLARAVEVGDGGRVDDLALVFVFAGVGRARWR